LPCPSRASIFIFTLAIPARRRWKSGKRTKKKEQTEFQKKPPAMAVFSFQRIPNQDIQFRLEKKHAAHR
jgi:hypothetical protein